MVYTSADANVSVNYRFAYFKNIIQVGSYNILNIDLIPSASM